MCVFAAARLATDSRSDRALRILVSQALANRRSLDDIRRAACDLVATLLAGLAAHNLIARSVSPPRPKAVPGGSASRRCAFGSPSDPVRRTTHRSPTSHAIPSGADWHPALGRACPSRCVRARPSLWRCALGCRLISPDPRRQGPADPDLLPSYLARSELSPFSMCVSSSVCETNDPLPGLNRSKPCMRGSPWTAQIFTFPSWSPSLATTRRRPSRTTMPCGPASRRPSPSCRPGSRRCAIV